MRIGFAASSSVAVFVLAIAARASADTPAAKEEVQPIPYAPSQPIPYGQPPPPTSSAPTYPPLPSAVQTPTLANASDIVVLKDGGLVRGTLLEIVPNDHATVQLPNGQVSAIPWTSIHHIERGAPPLAILPAAPESKTALEPTAEMATHAQVLAHIDSPRAISLERDRGGEDWEHVCDAPCDTIVPLAGAYRLAGEGLRPTKAFPLAALPGQRVVLTAAPSSKKAMIAGIVVAAVGIDVASVGGIMIDLARLTSAGDSGVKTSGTVLALVGLGAAAVGAIVFATNLHSSASQEAQSPKPAPLARTWLPTPTWHTNEWNAALPRASTFDLVHLTF